MNTELITREQWLADRQKGIGGSDVAPIMGLSRYATPLQVYMQKLGLATTNETEPMRWGTALEPIIRQRYCDETGNYVERVPMLRSNEHPFMLANVDGLIGDDGILEIKTARTAEGWGEQGTDEIPDEYALQCQHYMIVTGRVYCDVAVLIGGQDYRHYQLQADSELAGMIVEEEAKFWERVQKQLPPEPRNANDIKLRWPISKAIKVEATGDIPAYIEVLRVQKQQRDIIEQRIEQTELAIKEFMKDGDTLTHGEKNILATWKSTKQGTAFDLDRFKAEHPELFAAYQKTKDGTRRFLLKGE